MSSESSIAPKEAAPSAELSRLSDPQRAALSALFSGKAIREAACVARVHRVTVGRWLHHDPHFRAAYNAWRQELIDSSRARLLRTAELATAIVHLAIAKGDGRLALALLKHLGLASEASAGPSDPTLALDEITIEFKEGRDALQERLHEACRLSSRFLAASDKTRIESLRREAEKASDPHDSTTP
jgi:hypothetical protein